MKQLEFFPIEPRKLANKPRPSSIRQTYRLNPCDGCCLDKAGRRRVYPILAPNPLFIAVATSPGENESRTGRIFSGQSGKLLLDTLEELNLKVGTDVSLINLTRCQPLSLEELKKTARASNKGQVISDVYETPEWKDAQKRCSSYLMTDLSPFAQTPLMVLGTEPLQFFMRSQKLFIAKQRGFRRRAPDGRLIFPTWSPASPFHKHIDMDIEDQKAEFKRDIANAVAMIRGTAKPVPVNYHIYTEVSDINALLEWVAELETPWAFDLETFDGEKRPSRISVATDPCHEFFRIRGMAIAWDGHTGAYLELARFNVDKSPIKKAMTKAFGSPAPKWGTNGHFDEEGLVYPGWIPEVFNRAGDSMLSSIALSDGRLAGHSLERCVIDILREFYHWTDDDKSYMEINPIERVADGCVRDAAACYRLCDKLHDMMARGEYIHAYPAKAPEDPQHASFSYVD